MSTLGFRAGRRKRDVTLNVTSLIDVLFLLIIFFMLTGTFKRVGELRLVLPPSSTASATSAESVNDLELVAAEDGRLLLDGVAVVPEDLDTRLEEFRRADPERRIILKAESGVVHGRVVALLDAVQNAGFPGLSIGTEVAPILPEAEERP